ncbi:MAG: hypothetical protein ACR2OI_03690 [Acidimicrobiia bacterium]
MSETVTAGEYSPMPSLGRTSMIGAIAGAVDAIAVLILLSPLLLQRVTANSLGDGTARVDTVFEFSGLEISLPELISMGDITLFEGEWSLTPLFMFSLLAAIGFGMAGMLTVALTRWLPATVDPSARTGGDSRRLYLNGLGAGVIIGILAAQFAATWLGSDTGIGLEIPIFRFLITLVVAGVILGAGVVATSHLMARPDVVGVEGHTWETRSQFYRVLRRAISIPLTAVAIIAVVVVAFGVLLLAVEEAGKAGPLVLATVVSALILGAASFFAYKK